jgi:hypothetical protein
MEALQASKVKKLRQSAGLSDQQAACSSCIAQPTWKLHKVCYIKFLKFVAYHTVFYIVLFLFSTSSSGRLGYSWYWIMGYGKHIAWHLRSLGGKDPLKIQPEARSWEARGAARVWVPFLNWWKPLGSPTFSHCLYQVLDLFMFLDLSWEVWLLFLASSPCRIPSWRWLLLRRFMYDLFKNAKHSPSAQEKIQELIQDTAVSDAALVCLC